MISFSFLLFLLHRHSWWRWLGRIVRWWWWRGWRWRWGWWWKQRQVSFFQNLLNAQSSLCRNGGHSVITQLVAFISNKMKLYLSFFNRRWEDGNYWSHWNKPCCFAKDNISHNSVQVLYVAKFNTHIENLDNNWWVIGTICINKLKWPSGFTGKLHFVSSVVK